MSDEKTTDDKPDLVIDTDWKEQVAKEREQAEAERAATDSSSASDTDRDAETSEASAAEDAVSDPDATSANQSGASGESDLPPPPEASFEVLVSMLFTQGMAMLGQLPNPATGKPEVNKPYAKHYIDTLDMLGQKTDGNLSDDEKKMLSEALHALRMAFVSVKG